MEPSKRPDWSRETCVILASGPSLTPEQIDAVKHSTAKSITTNSTAFVAPWASVFYACDHLWFKTYHAKLDIKRCWTQDRASAERYGINYIRQSARPGLGKREVQVNGNSGFGATNLAFLFGCRRIILAGMDMRLGPKGQRHHHPDHPAPLVQAQQFKEWVHKGAKFFSDLREEGCEVLNATPNSALTMVKYMPLEEALKC